MQNKTAPPLTDDLKKNRQQSSGRKKREARSISMVIDQSLGKETAQLVNKLRRRLAALRRHHYIVLLTEGFSWLMAAVLGLALIQTLADYLLDIPWLARLGFLLMDLAALGILGYRKIYQPFSHHVTLDLAALKVERRWPNLKSRLISSVQLSRVHGDFPGGSPALIRRLLVQTTELAEPLNFKEVVSLKFRNRSLVTIGVALVVAGAAFFVSGTEGVILIKRLALYNIPLPSKTQVAAVSKNIYAAIGTDVTLSARAIGLIPAKGRLRIIDSKDAVRDFVAVAEKKDVFSCQLGNIQDKMTYQFFLGDGKGEVFTVYAEPPPVISKMTCEVTYPPYTGIGVRKMEPENLAVLAGSKIKISIVASAPLQTAKLVSEPDKNEMPLTLGMVDKNTATVEIPVPARGFTGFSIPLVNTDGIESVQNVDYRVDIIPDLPPVLKMLAPTAEKETITLRYRPEFIYQAKDDFGLDWIHLCYQVDEGGALNDGTDRPKKMSDVRRIGVPNPQGNASGKYVWDLSSANLHDGDIVNYWMEASDRNNVTGPGVTTIPQQQFVVVSPSEKRKELFERLQENTRKLDDLAKQQSDVQDSVGQVIKERGR